MYPNHAMVLVNRPASDAFVFLKGRLVFDRADISAITRQTGAQYFCGYQYSGYRPVFAWFAEYCPGEAERVCAIHTAE
jgi:hypothetical protein